MGEIRIFGWNIVIYCTIFFFSVIGAMVFREFK